MTNNSFSVKAIRLLSTLFLYFGYFFAGLIVVISLLHVLGLLKVGNIKVDFPVAVHYELQGVVSGDIPAEVEFEEATIDIALNDIPILLFAIHIVLLLFILGLMIYCARLFLQSINSIGKGEVFHIDNINRFKRIGIIMAVSALLPPFYLFAVLTGLNPDFEGVIFNYAFGPNWGLLLSGFFLMVMAEVFKRGLEMKNENDLTV